MLTPPQKVVVCFLLGVIYCSNVQKICAADRYWTNVLGGDFTNKTLWMTGIVPTNNDRVFVTNNTSRTISWTMNATNASAFFNNTARGISNNLDIGTSTWYITNQFMLGQNTGQSGLLYLVSGNLVITNAAGTASLVAGAAGFGRFNIEATSSASVIVDHIYATNFADSDFNVSGGTFTIQGDSEICTPSGGNGASALVIGLMPNAGTSTVNIINGTTIFGSNISMGTGTSDIGIFNIYGSGTMVSNRGQVFIGDVANQSEMWVSNGASWIGALEIFVGDAGSSNKLIISDSGTTFTNRQEIIVGNQAGSVGNFVGITNGADVRITQLLNGWNGQSNISIISSGSHLITTGTSGNGETGSNNTVIVTGAGTLVENQAFFNVGQQAAGIMNSVVVSAGAALSNGSTRVGNAGGSNTFVVTGTGTTFTNCGDILIGVTSAGNSMTVSNGGDAFADMVQMGSNSTATGNKLVVSGAGSLMSALNYQIGSNSVGGFGSGVVYISSGGTLEVRQAITNGLFGTGNISNSGGIYQFTLAAPTVVTNAGGTIFLTNGTISYRDIANAPVLITNQVSKFSIFGSNTFMLNNATNAILSSYTFTNGFGGTNYAHLTLVNGASSWRATNTTIGATSQMLVSNTAGSTFGTITNAGTLIMAGNGTTLTNEGKLIIIGNGAGGAGSIVNLVGTNSISGALSLGGDSTIGTPLDQLTLKVTLTNNNFQLTVTNTGSTTLEIASSIQGSGGIVHNGTGTLTLSGVNSAFSGTITNNAGGTLESASSTGLGTGNVVMNGGFLVFTNANQDYDQTFVFNNAVTQTVASGIKVTMGRNANDITGSGLIVKQGAGELIITNKVTQNASGGWRIDEGTVTMEMKGAIGTGTITLNGGELKQFISSFALDNAISVTADSTLSVTNGSDFTFNSTNITALAGTTLTLNEISPVAHSGTLFFAGSNFTYAGNLDLSDTGLRFIFNGASIMETDASFIPSTNYITGIISGLGDTTVNIGAFQVITNTTVVLTRTNTYTGTSRIEHGTVIVESEGAFGTVAGGTAITNNGTLAFLSNFTYSSAESIMLSSTGGVRGVGLVGVGGTNRFAGYITNANDSSIGTWAGNLTLSGGINMMGHSLVITNAANSVLTNSGIIVGSGPITHNGSGTVVFTGLNTFSGAVTNNAGTFEINSPTGLGTTTSVVLNGGTLLFKGSMTNTSAAVVLNGGIISEIDTNVSLGAMTVSANSSIILGSAGGAGRLTFASGTNAVGSGAKLTIYGWSWNSAMTGGSDDLIFFTNTSFETTSFLSNVNFFGTGGGARVLSSGELVPIAPEPGTIYSAFLLLGLICRNYFRPSKWF